MSERDPLDVAVDWALAALRHVARIAEQRDALDLRRVSDEARVNLLTAWERAE
jgi:hypothetical protein